MLTGRTQTRNSLTDDFKSRISPSAAPGPRTRTAPAPAHPATLISDPKFQPNIPHHCQPSISEWRLLQKKKKKKVNCFHQDCWSSAGSQVAIWFSCHNKEKWLKIMIRKDTNGRLNIFVLPSSLDQHLERHFCLFNVPFKPSATLNAWSSCSTEMIRFKKRKEKKQQLAELPSQPRTHRTGDSQTSWCERQHWCHAEAFPTLCPQKNKTFSALLVKVVGLRWFTALVSNLLANDPDMPWCEKRKTKKYEALVVSAQSKSLPNPKKNYRFVPTLLITQYCKCTTCFHPSLNMVRTSESSTSL